jgi:dethiobiotin synthetase
MPRWWSDSVRDLVVTGTDTGVGKTVIAAALVAALRARGVRALGFKPAETGVDEGHESDAERLARASAEQTPLAVPLLRLREPLAPAVAAERAGIDLDPDDLEARIAALRQAGYSLVIEGAGGALAPLVWEKRGTPSGPLYSAYTVLDLAERCGLDAVIVARAGLGTLNHVMMTVLLLQSRHVPIRGIVLNGRSASPDLAESTNPAALARMLPGIRIIEVPYTASRAIDHAAGAVGRLL